MIALAIDLTGWLVVAALVGIGVGWLSHEPGRGIRVTEEVWAVAAVWALCLGLSLAEIVPGRTGLWLDIGLMVFTTYIAGGLVGHLGRIPFDRTAAGRRMRAEEADRIARGETTFWTD